MRYMQYILVIAASLALSACGGGSSSTTEATGTGVISLNGGVGGTGTGGSGGTITTFRNSTSMVHGNLKFHKGGTVNAAFSVPTFAPNFGGNHAIVATDTQVASSVSTTTGTYYVLSGDPNLYLVISGVGVPVTGLTVNANVTFSLPNTNGSTVIPGGVVINGKVTTVSAGEPLDLRSGSLLQIGSSGTVTSQPAAAGTINGQITLVSGGVLINQGTITSSGVTGSGTAAGNITLEAGTFLYNTGKVTAMGDGAGNGGSVQLLADTASVYTGNTIDASGGSGTSGGNSGSISISGGSAGIGRVVVRGTVTGNGGNGSTGNGGVGAAITFTSSSGGILVNAAISASGGESTTAGNGGNGGTLQLNNNVGSDTAALHETSPEGIKVAGNISLKGGQGAVLGGAGGTISLLSDIAGLSLPGFANVEFFGYQAINLNGGDSTTGDGGSGGSVSGVLGSSPIVGVDIPAGGVVNQSAIHARGGKASSGTGGGGGQLTFTTPQDSDTSDPARSLVTNSGAIDVSGGEGNTGGAAGSVTITAYGNLTSSGAILAKGGKGTTNGGLGGAVNLLSSSNVVNSGAVTVSGGDGTGGNGGNAGNATLKSGNQTKNSAAITARGGNGNSSTGNGGNGGFITLSSEFAFISNTGTLSVAKGSGGSTNTAVIGIILKGNVNVTPSNGIL